MSIPEELSLSGLAALGTLGSVCAILLRSTHQNLKTLDTMRRDAAAATEKLRQELHDHDNTIFQLQSMCADYRFANAKLEAELLLRRAHFGEGSLKTDWSETSNNQHELPARQPDPRWSGQKNKTRNPEDVL